MPTFRKKPIEIEAHQFRSENPADGAPDWFMEAMRADIVTLAEDGEWYVQTLENGGLVPQHQITDGDWIIKGVAGELYPCKPIIFAATYDAVP